MAKKEQQSEEKAPGLIECQVLSALDHDGILYLEGASVVLTTEQAEILMQAGVVNIKAGE